MLVSGNQECSVLEFKERNQLELELIMKYMKESTTSFLISSFSPVRFSF